MMYLKHPAMRAMLLAGICAFAAGKPVMAANAPASETPSKALKTMPEADVSLKKVQEIFDAAYLKTEIDKEGDLKIDDDGVKTFVRVDPARKLITFFTAWGFKASSPEVKKLQLLNTLNNEVIFVRFSMPQPATLWCDYQFLYDGGMTPHTLISNYKQFVRVASSAVSSKDPDNLIGSD